MVPPPLSKWLEPKPFLQYEDTSGAFVATSEIIHIQAEPRGSCIHLKGGLMAHSSLRPSTLYDRMFKAQTW